MIIALGTQFHIYLLWGQRLCLKSVLNVKEVVAAFNQEKALVGAFSVIIQLHRLIVYSTRYLLQILGGDLPALHPLPQLHLHLDADLHSLDHVHHRLPRAPPRLERRELVTQCAGWKVHGE